MPERRVALIVPGFSADESDWCIPALLNLVRSLSRHVELHVFALRYPHRRDTYRIGNATVHSLGWAQRRGAHSVRLWAEAIRCITRYHRQKPFDLLHAFWAEEPAWIGAASARRLHIPLLVSLAGGELSNLPHIQYGLQRHRFARLLVGWSLRAADGVTAGSRYLQEIARAQGYAHCAYAPLGVDTTLFHPAAAGESERAACSETSAPSPTLPRSAKHAEQERGLVPKFLPPSIPRGGMELSQGPLLLNVGSLAVVKGQSLLLRAMQRVVAELPRTQLRIVGEGELRETLQAEAQRLGIATNVSICAARAHDQLPALYQAADLYVQSSWHESQGMAVLEAAACGVPLVGTNVGVLAELTPQAARVVPPGDERALAAAIISLLRDDALRRTLGQTARAIVEAEYSVERSTDRFLELYARTSIAQRNDFHRKDG